MKNLKKYLHILFIVILCFMFTISIICLQGSKTKTSFNQDNIITHIENLTKNGPRSISDKEENQLALDYITSSLEEYGLVEENTVDKPAYMIQDFVAEDTDYSNWYLKNIIVHIPANSSNPTNEAIMFMGHTDSVPMGNGASDDGVACGVMLEAIHYYLDKMANGYMLTNDLVFCFVNGEEYGLYGSHAFMNEFNGFNNIVDRIQFGTNLESRGTSGTLIMFETAKNNYNTMKLFSDINDNVFTCSIATMIYDMMPNGTDFSNFKEAYQGLNFANIAGGEDYHTQNDNLDNMSKQAYLTQQAHVVDTIIDKLSHYPLQDLYDASESAIFFSYLNITTVVYNHITAIILGIMAIVLILINTFLSKKNSSIKNTIKAMLSIIIGLVLTAVITYLCYYVFQYIAVVCGNIDKNMVGTITYSNIPMIIGIGILALAMTTFTSYLSIKYLHIEIKDLRKAFAYLHAVLGIVLSFVLSDASYMFIFSGILLVVHEIMIHLKQDIQNYHLELLITAFYFPLVLPLIVLATSALGLTMCYVFGLVFALAIFDIAIYLVPVCQYFSIRRLFKKETSVLEGVLHILFVAFIIFLAVSMTSINSHVNLQGKQGISKLPYDDALVYVDSDKEYRIYDLNAYQALKKYCLDMVYEEDHYVASGQVNVETSILSTVDTNSINIHKADSDSTVYLTFTNINATSFTIDDGKTIKTYKFEDNETYEITIHQDCIVHLDDGSVDVEYKEVLRDYKALIPTNYSEEEKLHFNLWLMENYKLNY